MTKTYIHRGLLWLVIIKSGLGAKLMYVVITSTKCYYACLYLSS